LWWLCVVFQRQGATSQAAVPARGRHSGRHRASIQGNEVWNAPRGPHVLQRLSEKGSRLSSSEFPPDFATAFALVAPLITDEAAAAAAAVVNIN